MGIVEDRGQWLGEFVDDRGRQLTHRARARRDRLPLDRPRFASIADERDHGRERSALGRS
jgi:hypothetical protein